MITAVLGTAITMLSPSITVSAYDFEASKAKLLRIGAALQVYRQQNPSLKPVSQRKNYGDAGLPQFPSELMAAGKPWSTNPADFLVQNSSNDWPSNARSHFHTAYRGPNLNPNQWKDAWAARGEQMPFLFDYNGYTMNQIAGNGSKRILILRINGQVADVNVDGFKPDVWILEK